MSDNLPLHWRRYPERYYLKGTVCETCNTAYFPPRKVCPKCRRKGKIKEEIMPKTGKIISFTELSVGPMGFEHETPYFLALIELDNGAKLLSQVVDSKKEKIKENAKVKKVFRKIADNDPEGAISYGFKFKVVE